MNRPTIRDLLRNATLAVAFLAIAMSSAIPAGTMLQRSANGAVELVLCTGTGEQKIIVDASGQKIPDQNPQTRTDVCVWSSAHDLATALVDQTPNVSADLVFDFKPAAVAVTFANEQQWSQNAPRGPPILL